MRSRGENGGLLKVEEKRGGRPRKDLGKEDLDRVEQLASRGVAQRDIVPVLTAGIAERTLRDKIATDHSFAARLYRALCVFLANRLSRTTALVGKGSLREDEREQVGENEEIKFEQDKAQAHMCELEERMFRSGRKFPWFAWRPAVVSAARPGERATTVSGNSRGLINPNSSTIHAHIRIRIRRGFGFLFQ